MTVSFYKYILITIAPFVAFAGEAQVPNQAKDKPVYTLTEKAAKEIVTRVLKSSPVIDGHNDLLVHYFDCKDCPKDLNDHRIDTINNGQIDIPRLRRGGVGSMLMNIFGRERNLDSYMQGWDLLYRMEEAYSKDRWYCSRNEKCDEAGKNCNPSDFGRICATGK